MSQWKVVAGPALAAVCGVLIAVSTLQPALQQQRDEREGKFVEQHDPEKDTALSRAILDDMREARREVSDQVEKGGFAWGIRQAWANSTRKVEEVPTAGEAQSARDINEKGADGRGR